MRADYSFGVVAVGSQYAIIQYNNKVVERRYKTFEESNNMLTEGVVRAEQAPRKPGAQVYDTLSCQVDYERVLELLKSIEKWIEENKSRK